jgi:tRNA1(Val) A37 N6-methylase TrmN6
MKDIPTTLDGLLNRRVTLEQPVTGYRVALDTVLLAAAVPALAGDKVLDIGCGVGGAFLSLACRVEAIAGIGMEIQPELAELCRRNIARNFFAAGFECRLQDATHLPTTLYGQFDHVLMNPPYHEEARHDVSSNDIKRAANTEKDGDLALWIKVAVLALKPSGTLTLIHRADRQQEILSCMQDFFGNTVLFPLLPKPDADPKRIIIRARKDGLFFVSQNPPLTLHKPEGGYTDEAENILRHCGALGHKT